MKIGLYTNKKRDANDSVSAKIIKELDSHGISAVVLDSTPIGVYERLQTKVTENVDMVIAIGGDGTMLEVAKLFAPKGVAILGVNKGKLGFLSEIDETEIKTAVDAVVSKNYFIEKRRLMSVTVAGREFIAVNDAVLSHRDYKMISVDIRINGTLADSVKGDGVIVSTPTGSTAYSLSVGGPVLSPKLNALLIAGICPHSLHSRPIVTDGDSEVEIVPEINVAPRLILDGNEVADYNGGAVTLKMSDMSAGFVRTKEVNFYGKLLDKMKYW